jgi:hypothetical protein
MDKQKKGKWTRMATLVAVNFVLTVVPIEAALRLFPQVIPADLLVHFEPTMRSKIATGRFPTADDAIAFERDDGGFPFSIWKPFAEINYSFRDLGTVNTVKMDEIGFCNPPNLYSQQASFDVIALGDSFTWCTTVRPQDTWVAQLAQQEKVSAYNLGKPAIGLYEYLQLLKRFGLPKSPKVVVLSVYEGNDLRDALKYSAYRRSGAIDQVTTVAAQKNGPMSRYSYTWNLMKAAILSRQAASQNGDLLTAATPEGYSEEGENFRYSLNFKTGKIDFNLENGDLDEVVNAKLLADGHSDLAVFSEAIAQFKSLAEAHNFEPIVVYIPSAYTTYADVVNFEQPQLNQIMPAYSQQQRQFFATQTESLGLPFLDLTSHLQSVSSAYSRPENLLYYPTNRHLTQQGHAVVAGQVAKGVKGAIKVMP